MTPCCPPSLITYLSRGGASRLGWTEERLKWRSVILHVRQTGQAVLPTKTRIARLQSRRQPVLPIDLSERAEICYYVEMFMHLKTDMLVGHLLNFGPKIRCSYRPKNREGAPPSAPTPLSFRAAPPGKVGRGAPRRTRP